MQRHALGIISILFVVAWGCLLLFGRGGGMDRAIAGSAMRIGLVLGALWLALPQLRQVGNRFPPWFLGTLGACCLIVAVRPRMAAYVIPVVAAIAVLQFVGYLFKPPASKM